LYWNTTAVGGGPGFCEENTTRAPFSNFGLRGNSEAITRHLGKHLRIGVQTGRTRARGTQYHAEFDNGITRGVGSGVRTARLHNRSRVSSIERWRLSGMIKSEDVS